MRHALGAARRGYHHVAHFALKFFDRSGAAVGEARAQAPNDISENTFFILSVSHFYGYALGSFPFWNSP